MSLFHNILKQITNSLTVDESNKEGIAEEISKVIGVNIKPDQIKITDKKIFLSVSPTIKTTIQLKKTLILKTLEKYKIDSIV